MNHSLIEITTLRARRNTTFELAIDDLKVSPGSILCVAGPNGSGKSTFISCLVGLLRADSGHVLLDGNEISNDLKATKAILGYIPDDEDWFVKELTAREYVALIAGVYADAGAKGNIIERANELAEKLYFSSFDQRLEYLSHGNKKKVQLITGLMHQPKIVIIDELRNGLDPLAIIAAEQLIKAEAGRGACIVAATHDLWWAQRVADDIVLLIDGRVAVRDRAEAIVKQYGSVEKLFMEKVGMARG